MAINALRFKSLPMLVLSIAMIPNTFANGIQFVGSLTQRIKTHPGFTASSNEKTIQLLKIQLSEEAKARLHAQSQDALYHKRQFSLKESIENNPLPATVLLGMNHVPVLDQGIHGTCVTFAVTAGVDAIIGKGDYVSQLCNLQLGTYLEKHGYGISGWEGSYANMVINQMEQFGIINKQKQYTYGCGGLKTYPTYSAHDSESFMEPEKYSALSEPVFGNKISWLDVLQENNPPSTLNQVKEALHAGDRLVFAVMLPRTELGFVGAVGKYKTWIYKDSWVLTPEILTGLENIEAAHEMIITGYDDNAVAVDNHGKKHKGLLKLRNSWGTDVGDDGEFYMSYDYFKLLAFDVTRLSPIQPG